MKNTSMFILQDPSDVDQWLAKDFSLAALSPRPLAPDTTTTMRIFEKQNPSVPVLPKTTQHQHQQCPTVERMCRFCHNLQLKTLLCAFTCNSYDTSATSVTKGSERLIASDYTSEHTLDVHILVNLQTV